MTARRSLSRLQRAACFAAAKGICHICGAFIRVGDPWDVEHVVPLALGGADDESNMRPAHRACHAAKTPEDRSRIAKAARQHAKHIGARKPSAFRRPDGVKYDWRRGRYVRQEAT